MPHSGHPSLEIHPSPHLGSEGISWDWTAPDTLHVHLAPSRGLPAVPNMLQLEIRNPARLPLQIHTTFDHPEPKGKFDEYHHSVTPDFQTFRPAHWQLPANGTSNILTIPATPWDTVHLGMQFPLPLAPLSHRLRRPHPHASLTTLGHSLQGRPIELLRIGDPAATPAVRHLVVNQHPGEGNARWRIMGMIDWLLADTPAAAHARRHTEWHFLPLLCPDGPANGWRRVNADGIDMNRCFHMDGANPDTQTPEAYLLQHLLETAPPHVLWCMHTWPGPTEPIIDGTHPAFDAQRFAQTLARLAPPDTMKPVRFRPEPGMTTGWNGGPRVKYQIGTLLVEGGGDPADLDAHLHAGRLLMQAAAPQF